jgi:hypothetical protein
VTRIVRLALVVVVPLVVACEGGWRPHSGTPNPATSQALADADQAALAGRARDATTRYEAIVHEHPTDPAAAEALHRLIMLRLEPGSPVHDRHAATQLLRRLATEHPDTLVGREARTWRTLLQSLDKCEVEAARSGADADKLRQTLESVKDSDIESEQHR